SYSSLSLPYPHSFPTRRSSDLKPASKTAKLPEWNLADLYSGIDAPEVARDLETMDADCVAFETDYKGKLATGTANEDGGKWLAEDRKSTRLNSSHGSISYAVFC